MLYVYKLSEKPLQPWSMVRTGGANNIAPQAKGRYLVLQNAEALYRDGAWHYVLEFDVRDSLALSPLAQMMGKKQVSSYPDGTNWRKWLGDHWQVIDEHVRWQILHSPDIEAAPAEGQICDVRELPEWHPHPQPQKRLTLFPTPVAATVPAVSALPEMTALPPIPPAAVETSPPAATAARPSAAHAPAHSNKPLPGHGHGAPNKGKHVEFPLDLDAALGGAIPQPVA